MNASLIQYFIALISACLRL